jgi:hypothetical protein
LPVVLVVLVTKKPNLGPTGEGELSPSQPAMATNAIGSR